MELPDPGKHNATQSEEMLLEILNKIRHYLSKDEGVLIHLRNCKDSSVATAVLEVVDVIDHYIQ